MKKKTNQDIKSYVHDIYYNDQGSPSMTMTTSDCMTFYFKLSQPTHKNNIKWYSYVDNICNTIYPLKPTNKTLTTDIFMFLNNFL